MALELIAALIAAVACAGLALIAGRLSGGRLPRWFMPFAAALGLIGFTIWSEYSWFSRVSGELPEGVMVIDAPRTPQVTRPWTFIVPMTSHFTVVDTRKLAAHPARATLVMVPIYAFARWNPVRDGYVVVDCMAKTSVMLTDAVTINDAGTLTGGEWSPATEAMLGTICLEG